jgi:hypothetical protein
MYDIEKVKSTVQDLIKFLGTIDSGSYFEQMNYLQRLVDLIERKETFLFTQLINSAELWGGSGSVWESAYGMTTEQKNRFDHILFQLLLSMEEENIIQQRAKKILKLLDKKV